VKNSISYANEIIQVLGKPPEEERIEMEELFFMVLVIAIIISAVGAVIHAIIKRKHHFD
jgi:Na+-driven multidrug efflux pump